MLSAYQGFNFKDRPMHESPAGASNLFASLQYSNADSSEVVPQRTASILLRLNPVVVSQSGHLRVVVASS